MSNNITLIVLMLELSTVFIQAYFHPTLLFALIQLETVLSHIEIIQIHADVLKIDTVKILIYACPQ